MSNNEKVDRGPVLNPEETIAEKAVLHRVSYGIGTKPKTEAEAQKIIHDDLIAENLADDKLFKYFVKKINEMSQEDKKINEMSQEEIIDAIEQTPEIILPPGHKLTALAELVLSPEKFEIVCQSSLADWHKEYFEALDNNRGKMKMASIRIRHTCGFLLTVGIESFFKVIGQIISQMRGTGGGD